MMMKLNVSIIIMCDNMMIIIIIVRMLALLQKKRLDESFPFLTIGIAEYLYCIKI